MNAGGAIGGGVILIITVMVAMMMFPSLMNSTSDIQSDPASQITYSSTGAGVTTEDVLLTDPLLEGDIANVTSITSDNGSDTPAASAYVSTTDTLTVAGLASSGTRNLTIAFEADALAGYTGMSDFVKMAPFLIFISLIGVAIFGLYGRVKGGG